MFNLVTWLAPKKFPASPSPSGGPGPPVPPAAPPAAAAPAAPPPIPLGQANEQAVFAGQE